MPDFEEETEWIFEPQGTFASVYGAWREFNWVLNDLSYISSEVICNAKRGVQFEVGKDGKIVAMPTTLGPGADLGIYEERLNKATELLSQLNAEIARWSERTGNPAPDMRELNRDFEPMTMDTHRFAHRKTMELSEALAKEWTTRYNARYVDGVFRVGRRPREVRVRKYRYRRGT